MSTQTRTVRDLAESYWAAEARRDIDAVMEHYHPDATYQDAAGRLQGHREIRDFYRTSVETYPSLQVDIVREYSDADAAAMEFVAILWDGHGQAWTIRGVNVFRVADGQFTSVRSYEDPPTPATP